MLSSGKDSFFAFFLHNHTTNEDICHPWLWILQLKTGARRKSAWILISPLDIIGDVEMISVRTLIVLSVISAPFPGVWLKRNEEEKTDTVAGTG